MDNTYPAYNKGTDDLNFDGVVGFVGSRSSPGAGLSPVISVKSVLRLQQSTLLLQLSTTVKKSGVHLETVSPSGLFNPVTN